MKNNKALNILLALVYYAALNFVLYVYIGELFEYYHFKSEFNLAKTLISIATIVSFYTFFNSSNLVLAFSHLLYALMLVPTLSIFSVGGAGYNFYFVSVLSIFIVVFFATYYKPKTIKAYEIDTNLILRCLFTMCLVYICAIIALGGLKHLNFNLSKVYEVREEASSILPSYFGYISPIIGKVAIPLMIVIAAVKKKWSYLVSGIGFSILIFGFTAHRSPLIYPFIILCIYYLPWRNLPTLILLGCISICLLSALDFFWMVETDNPFAGWFGSLFSRRALLVPANLNNVYIEFFAQNEVYYWAASKFSLGLSESPYHLPYINLIGYEYYGDSEITANTGWIGAGYANARLFGTMFYSILLGVLIAFMAAIGEKVGQKFMFSASFVTIMTLILSTDFSTAILTHGLLALLFILMFIKKDSLS
ncbi:MAG: hypothetical protein VX100_05985 [Pseudomonadota bacterium]|nr:hypothetical protein [Pseudomonadota bacterium]